MGTRLYVGNLPFDVDEAQLRTLFQEGGRGVGEVKIVTDRDTGRPRGFAFVEMASQAERRGVHGSSSLRGVLPPRGGATVRGAKGSPRSHSIGARGTSQKPTFAAGLPAGV